MRRLVTAVLAASLLATAPAIAETGGPQARVIVPDVPGGADVGGCYRSTGGLYGPYRLTFCMKKKGVYYVRGGGVECNGRMDWKTEGRDVRIHLRRQSCNKGVAWAEGNMTCGPTNILAEIIAQLLGQNQRKDPQGRVIVPDAPKVRTLRCTYYPTVPGEKRTTFLARRID